MRNEARVVVVGGGVVGVSTLYHLARKGWSDAVLVERKELTSGSTWHAAGLLPLFNMSYSVGQIHKYSVRFYRELERETGMNVGFTQCSNIRLARTRDRWDEFMYYAGVAETIGVDVRLLTPDEVKAIWPLCETEGLLGAIQHPEDGYIQPADLTQALAKGARDRGAAIYRNTAVTAITPKDGGWLVTTDKGEIACEHVVSATGNFARRTGAMVGLDVPVIPVEHQYIVTEPHPAIVERKKQGLPEMGVLREADSSWYMREENGGLLLGPYEKGAPCCYVDGPSDDSEYELFQEDLERLMPHVETAIARVPAFGEVGIKKIYNGAIAYTPDGSPAIGPAPGLRNFWLNEGHSFGVTAAGGAGWQLAEWIVDGEPTIDMTGVDPRRFGPYATEGYLREKNEEAYANVYTMHYPDEERAAARPLKMAPCYGRMKARGAVFGSVYGWERPNWFAPAGYAVPPEELGVGADVLTCHNHAPPLEDGRIVEKWSFRRSNYFEHVGNEVRHVHEKAGLLDMSAFAKIEVSGPGARAWLDSILANRIPKKRGRIALCHLLTATGGVKAEFTVYEWKPGRFYLVSAGGFEAHDHDVLARLVPDDGSVVLRPLTAAMGVLVLAGPRSRDILARLTRTGLSNAEFPWLSGRPIALGHASAHALRVNFVGELGWELHHPIEQQNAIFDLLMEAGAEFDLKPFGIRAMTAMAIEKSYRLIPRELSIEYSAWESGLDRFVHPDKGDFIGRDALLRLKEEGPRWRFVTLEVHGVGDADARGNEAIHKDGRLVGRATHGSYGWRVGKSLALAMVKPEVGDEGSELEITILGKPHRATVIGESPYDPQNQALRADG
ncbi:FAD-dependent oxidoreductase [Aquibium sp. A9E412]|uniref:GcvT family protein n=1 Tax=Aquibium sp. A9E412 TaxID=2976767 RepID=UPI0025AFFBE0|nr:FAD-dependent oxidoreductase [Aquibium sp. A9E412]MDN2568325.1 FAD-dependent oxidoreductase [Aquibium sp. A9E412]